MNENTFGSLFMVNLRLMGVLAWVVRGMRDGQADTQMESVLNTVAKAREYIGIEAHRLDFEFLKITINIDKYLKRFMDRTNGIFCCNADISRDILK